MRLFVCSDLHSFFTPFKKALDDAGFIPNYSEHKLIVCGDVWDRGSESYKLMQYLDSLTNVVLIRGNHEDLLEEMLSRGYGEKHDIANSTVWTVCQLADAIGVKAKSTYEVCKAVEEFVKPFLNKFVNYLETKNFLFVHSWIPCKVRFEGEGESKPWYTRNKTYAYMPDWREANEVEWEEARWGNPFNMAEAGLNKTGKTIVFGHFHSSWPRANYEGKPEFGEGADFSPYYGKDYIALDACTAASNLCNVIVLEDTLLGG